MKQRFFFLVSESLSIFQQRAAATNHRTSSDRSSMVSILNHWATKVSFPPFNLYIFLYWTQHPPNRETKELHTQPTFIVKSCDLTVEYIYSPHTCQIMASRGNWTDTVQWCYFSNDINIMYKGGILEIYKWRIFFLTPPLELYCVTVYSQKRILSKVHDKL